jgi:hypothetical protein
MKTPFLVVFALSAIATTALDGQVDFTGKWQIDLPSAAGERWTFDLSVSGQTVTGTVTQGFPEFDTASVAIYDGTIAGNEITFKAKSPNGQRIVSFNGMAHGNEIAFTRTIEVPPGLYPGGLGIFGVGGPSKFTAKRK